MLRAVLLPEASVANLVIGSAPPSNSWRPAHDAERDLPIPFTLVGFTK